MKGTIVTEDFMRDLLAPIAATAAVRESAGPEDEGAAIIREAKASILKRHRRLTDAQATYVVDRSINIFAEDPYSDESFGVVVTRESDAFVDTLPEPLGREGSVQFFDALIDARNGR